MRRRLFPVIIFITGCLAAPAATHGQQETIIDSIHSIQEGVIEPPDADSAVDIITDAEDGDTSEEKIGTERTEYFTPVYMNQGQDAVLVRTIADSVKNKTKIDPDYWYADYKFTKPEKREARRGQPFWQSEAFDTILWLLIIGGFATILIMYLSQHNKGLFRRAPKSLGTDEETETDDIFAIDYNRDIHRAEQEGNYRLATRLHFLQLLRGMADRNIIQYKQDRTNLDYLMQLSSTAYYADFFRVTRSYEYSWYGQFELDRERYDKVKIEFAQLQRKFA